MNLNALEKKDNFFNGLKTLFASLNVPVNYIDEKSIAPKEILSKTFKENTEAYQLMDDVFVLGMVDNAAFEGNKSETIAGISKGKKDYEGILLFGVTLKHRSNGLLPTRSQLAEITRAFNREFFYTPVVVIFRYEHFISIANAERIIYKQEWREGEKAGKVSLLRDINVKKPHTGHLKILQELTISRTGKSAVNTFADLYIYWQSVFNVSILNKKFYKELSDWYFWALHEVAFPTTADAADKTSLLKDDERVKEHNAKNLIRLLTRLLFVWFVKEKNLIPEELFDETYIKENLINGFEPRKKKNFDHKTQGSKYYRAILQNLFFASLNQTVGKREFRKDGLHMNVTNLMRYESYFKTPKVFINLVENIVPFMNGGLFECLDSPDPLLKGKRGGDVIVYEDGFSDRKDNTLCVPDYIFFGTDEHADLSEELGDKKHENVTVNGLINILNSYKFTVTENTPIEEDVALDPELLGRVFENLLASYNPETKTTARKQTGSFYTPREIVNYMVDESLKAYLKQKLETEAGMKPEDTERKLDLLIGYNETYFLDENRFDDKQTTVIINAIDNCKILDPACGSGAFPMGILHKLVHVLHKLDADNKLWKEVQRKKAIKETEDAFKIGNKQDRENRLKEISDVFEYNSDDYGRKLFLIENCIYGVDIQPIATQISKLRFFISLIIDQKADKSRDNFGIRPLPNLETKFVAANTLIEIEKPKIGDFVGSLFDNTKVKELEEKLQDVRHRLFSAKTPATKRKLREEDQELREEDQELREEMGSLLEDAGWTNDTARQLAGWDPYNQNASSPFFNREWMFGITEGFDVVIGNPPYIDSEMMVNCGQGALREYLSNTYEYTKGNWDIYIAFFEKAFKLIKPAGTVTYITPDKWLTKPFGEIFRTNKISFLSILLKSGRDIFDSVGVDSIVTIFSIESSSFKFKDYIAEQVVDNCVIPKNIFQEPYQLDIIFSPYLYLLLELATKFSPLSNSKCLCENACATSDAYLLKTILKNALNNYDAEKFYKVINTGTIDKFCSRWGKKEMTYLKDKYLYPVVSINDFHRVFPNSYGKKPKMKKLIIKGLTLLDATLDLKGEYIPGKTTLMIISDNSNILASLSVIINSRLAQFYITERYSSSSYNGGVNFTKDMLKNFPLPLKLPHAVCFTLANILKTVRYNEEDEFYNFMYSLSNSVTYELYFPDEIKAADAEVLKHLTNLPELKEDWSDEKKMKTIEKVYQELSDPKQPVAIAMERQKTVKEVRIIEGLGK